MDIKKIDELSREIENLGRFYGTFEEQKETIKELESLYIEKNIIRKYGKNERFICKTKDINNTLEVTDYFGYRLRKASEEITDSSSSQNNNLIENSLLFDIINNKIRNFQKKYKSKDLEFIIETPISIKSRKGQSLFNICYKDFTFPVLNFKLDSKVHLGVKRYEYLEKPIIDNLNFISKVLDYENQ